MILGLRFLFTFASFEFERKWNSGQDKHANYRENGGNMEIKNYRSWNSYANYIANRPDISEKIDDIDIFAVDSFIKIRITCKLHQACANSSREQYQSPKPKYFNCQKEDWASGDSHHKQAEYYYPFFLNFPIGQEAGGILQDHKRQKHNREYFSDFRPTESNIKHEKRRIYNHKSVEKL